MNAGIFTITSTSDLDRSHEYSSFSFSCVDVNECAESEVCGEHSECVNRPGTYDCICEKGSICGDGFGVECVNRPGSYECRCKDGFDGDPKRGCSDINECEVGTQHCGTHAKCINTIGGYECECLPGFERITEGAGCTDIDECFLSMCHPAASCSNLVGSFSCSCPDGFVGDGMHCHGNIQLFICLFISEIVICHLLKVPTPPTKPRP
ncbi:unnamed protein product [Nippostrongylus brasiliensis]|uniref:EGF-like domain-containing protein n=1 Tax=Nippostrongylus brasiliensis TaxID=27835 RepID=A0A3P7A9X0_NIPBR|nr:unnamed protein product [Nippostrongylus brasiliensis]